MLTVQCPLAMETIDIGLFVEAANPNQFQVITKKLTKSFWGLISFLSLKAFLSIATPD